VPAEISVIYDQFVSAVLPITRELLQVSPGHFLARVNGDWRAYAISDEGVTLGIVDQYHPLTAIGSTDWLLGVRVGGTAAISGPVSLTAGSVVNIKDSVGGSLLALAGRLTVETLDGASPDGANNAVAQQGVANVAVQVVTSGILYRELWITNFGGNIAYLGFDNTVAVGTGYPLGANLGADSTLPLKGFNANLWAISNIAGTTLAILARG